VNHISAAAPINGDFFNGIGKDAIGLGREEQVRQGRGPSTHRDGGKCRSLGRLAMTDGRPTP
jgi:hypothetical protein